MSDPEINKKPEPDSRDENYEEAAVDLQSEPAEGEDLEGAQHYADAEDGSHDSSAVSYKETTVVFESFTIHLNERLPNFDVAEVKAYKVSGNKRMAGEFFALVCERHLLPRRKIQGVYKAFLNPHLAPLMMGRTIYWPPTKQETYVLIYQNVLGNRLLKPGAKAALGMKPDLVIESVVRPMLNVLQDFHEKDTVHGAIRTTNMYDGGHKGKNMKIIMGDCLAVPASYAQPVLYETIQRGMADPIGRGVGTIADDLYSFGVSLAVMLRHHDTTSHLSDEDLIKQKIERGTYPLLLNRDRIQSSILELVRGLTQDQVSERWTIDEFIEWMEGTRLNPKQSGLYKKASRPVIFNGKKFLRKSLLAMEFPKNPVEVRKLVESGEIEQWVSRALEEDITTERLEEAIARSADKGKGPGYEDRLTAFVSAVLHPGAPLRFRELKVMGDGFGASLAQAMVLKKDITSYVDAISQGVLNFWLKEQEGSGIDIPGLFSKFEACRNFIRQKRMGYGVERCLYHLAPEMYCMSDKLKQYRARTPEAFVLAWEKICEDGETPLFFFDRHSAAFIAVHENKAIEPVIHDLDSEEDHKKVLANLKCMANLQKKCDLSELPHIAQCFLKRLNVVYARYHDRDTRDKIQEKVEYYAKRGDLLTMTSLLDSTDIVKKDFVAFRKAMREYSELSKELAGLEKKLQDPASFGKKTGKEVAAVVSCIIAGLCMLGMGFLFLMGKTVL